MINPVESLHNTIYQRRRDQAFKNNWQRIHIDPILLALLGLLLAAGLAVLFSASNQSEGMMLRQLVRVMIASVVMIVAAQINPQRYRQLTPFLFLAGISLLAVVLLIGVIGKGAQRWLDLGIIRFQPSEIMKLASPMMIAWYLDDKPLPPSLGVFAFTCMLLFVPALMVAKQPDLGTAIMIISAGGAVLLFAGLSWRIIAAIFSALAVATPILWHFLHQYQRQRVLTFLYPERDPLGSGYHIIQSKIAIGSGGVFGKGWFLGSQSHLQFLPEHATDFIFAVCGEEFGLLGCLILLTLYVAIFLRTLFIAIHAQDTFSRLVAASLGFSFFFSAFVNIGMVSGLLPVVGLPLPLVSYGGTSMVTVLACFGIIMSIHTHRNLVPR